ncbi:B3 domain-containing protein [Trifolium pratense]|uniref:B3 domain-containing protein n=1 Tax=Trifolium pratense TaxID=57577 RepID=A0A2K3L9K8_TRIPR|nr:B3 domain-containing protein [Trifolium pratense]PNY08590.1 B3 domain-containing protein [Trifolium pratense]
MSLYNTPKFFKIIQNHELQNGEIRIPKKFVGKYWKGMPNPVVITLPNGVEQELFWVKHDGDIWLQKNWEKIAKFLKFGYLVIFKYIGGVSFKLKIFGIDCLEIDYSKIKFRDEQVVSDDDSVEVTKSQKKRKMKVEFDIDTSSDELFVDQTNIAGTSQTRKRASNRRIMKKKATKCSTNGIGIGTSRGVTPSFKLKLTKTYATGYLFRIPCDFSRTYLKDFEGTVIMRKMGEDRIWRMDVRYDPEGDFSVVNSGWKPFCEQYNLQTRDVCKFEMTRSKPLSFAVAINPEPEGNLKKKMLQY